MEIGIGIPNTVPGATGPLLLEWARRAEAAGFSSLGTIGAVSFPAYEELTVFAAAGAVTERIRFVSNVLIAPARSTAELAKQAATVQELTGGRLTLGIGVGWRESDYLLTGREFHRRGALFDRQLDELRRALDGEAIAADTRPVVPAVEVRRPVPLLIGGMSDATIGRVVRHGVGWSAGGAPPDAVRSFMTTVLAAWQEAGRDGRPRITALSYFGFGDTVEDSRRYLLHYYDQMGEQMAQMIAGSPPRSADAVSAVAAAFAELEIDELIFVPTVPDLAQLEQLADTVL